MNTIEDKLKATVTAAAIIEKEEKHRRVFIPTIKWAVPVAAAIAIALIVIRPKDPKDTFTDPQLAYAEVEKAFAYISNQIEKGSEIAAKAEEPIESIKTIFK